MRKDILIEELRAFANGLENQTLSPEKWNVTITPFGRQLSVTAVDVIDLSKVKTIELSGVHLSTTED